MKFFLNYYDNLLNRPTYKFFLNLFFLKNNQYFVIKQLNFIHIYLHLIKKLKIKIFKFNYIFYNNFIIYFIIINIVSQIFIFLLI